MNYRGRIKRLEVEARRQSLAKAGGGPLRFSRGGLVGGGNMDLNELKKSQAAYKKATREDKP
jgi:hypothetical protein